MSQDLGARQIRLLRRPSLAMQHIVGIHPRARRSRLLSGVHAGCDELFGQEGIRGVADLKVKKVGLTAPPRP